MAGFDAGSIIAKLELQKNQWDASMRSIQKDLSEVGKSVETSSKKMAVDWGDMAKKSALAVTAVTGALFALVKKTADYGDELWKTSQKTGIAVETLSGLKLAADKSDLSLQGLAMGMARLARLVVEANQGGKEQAAILERIGVTATDTTGKMKPMDALMGEVADKFKDMPDGVEKTAMAMDIFGKSGMEMIPLLNLGSAGLKKEREEAERLGLVMSGDTAKASEAFNDELTTLNKALLGVVLTIGKELLPVFKGITEAVVGIVAAFNNWMKQNPEIIQAIRNIIESIKWLVTGIKDAIEWVGKLTDKLNGMNRLRAMAMQQAASEAAKFDAEQKSGHERWLARHNAMIAKRNEGAAQVAVVASKIIAAEKNITSNLAGEAAKREAIVKRQIDRFEKEWLDFAKSLAASNKRSDKSVQDLTGGMEKLFGASFGNIARVSDTLENQIKRDLDAIAKKTKETATQMKATFGDYLQIVQQGFSQFFSAVNALSQARYEAEMSHLETEYQRRKKAIEDSLMSEEEKNAAMGMLDEEFASKRRALEIAQAKATKDSNIAQAYMNMFAAIVASWKLGWPLGAIAAAIAAAACMIQIKAIKAQPLPGMANGGLLTQATPVVAGEAGPEAFVPLPELKDMLGVGKRDRRSSPSMTFNISAIDAKGVERITRSRIIPEIKRAMGRESFRVPAHAVGG